MTATSGPPLHITFISWRDPSHPEAGGSEVFIHECARRLATRGDDVVLHASRTDGQPTREVIDGVTVVRSGGVLSQRVTALPTVWRRHRAHGRRHVVVDVINGLPYLSSLVPHSQVVGVFHHSHQYQWQSLYPGARGRLGAWLERKATPRLYGHSELIVVSQTSRDQLAAWMPPGHPVHVVLNGVTPPSAPGHPSPTPRLCVLARQVPHKQITHALDVAAALVEEYPDLRLDVIGDGPWAGIHREYSRKRGLTGCVEFHGWLEQRERDRVLGRAWVLVHPSAMEGWGLAIMEAAALGVPAVAYRDAGGVSEAIVEGQTGLLSDSTQDLTEDCRRLVGDPTERLRLGAAAHERAAQLSWDATAENLRSVLVRQLALSP